MVVEKAAPGGQAGSSSKIENYLGFLPELSGQELADRAIAQAEKFGAHIMVARSVVRLNCNQRPYRDHARRRARDSGAHHCSRHRRAIQQAALPRLESFAGKGIYYNATYMEAQVCTGEPVIVIGGGNSAGQAAIFLAQNTAGVTMLVRSAACCHHVPLSDPED